MSNPTARPEFVDAPGLVVRQRPGAGHWVAFWQCRADKYRAGFRPGTAPLWRGLQPSRLDRVYVSDQCIRMQNHMLAFGEEDRPPEPVSFAGTVRSLIYCFKHDTDSTYFKLRYQTRGNYDSLMRRIEKDLGDVKVADIDARKMIRTHEDWTADGHISMAHSLIAMMRVLCTYGSTLLKSPACKALKSDLSELRFEMAKQRNEFLTAEQAAAVCATAHAMGFPEVALAQAIQFECMLRQRDCIGEWVPTDEPGMSDVVYNKEKWLRGIRWTEIDDNLTLRHVTSKRLKEIVVDLKLAPMVLAELGTADRTKLPATGPVIVYSKDGRPFTSYKFRWLWRKVADMAGVPKSIRNMDSRAGAITEASDSGAELEMIRHAATHSTTSMTARYSRGAAEKTAVVMQMRAKHRNKKET